MDARLRRLFGPLPLLLLGLSLAMGWASFPLWQASNQLSEGMRVCYERVNLSLMAHTLKIKRSEFLGASFFQGTEECWGELVSLLSSSGVVTSQASLQKSNEIALELHKFNLAVANGESNTKTVLEYWNPLRENIDQLRSLLSTENEMGLLRIKSLAGTLSLTFFALTFFSWMRSRRSTRNNLDNELTSAVALESTYIDSLDSSNKVSSVLVETSSTGLDLAPAIEVADLLQQHTEVSSPSIQLPLTSSEVIVTESENKNESEIEKIENQVGVETSFKQQVPVLTMGEYIEKLLHDQSDKHFLQGIFVKKQILKDFKLNANAEAFQNGLFYLMNLHGSEQALAGKTIQIILRENHGQVCLSIQSGPVKNWESDNINLLLATEALKDAGLNLEWEMSFLGTESHLVTTCRAPIPTPTMSIADNITPQNKLTRLVRGKKSQIQKRLRDLSN